MNKHGAKASAETGYLLLPVIMIKLIVNGQPQHVPILCEAWTDPRNEGDSCATLNVRQLLEHMGLQGKRIAIERNGEIVPRSLYDQPLLVNGDRLEIVVAVGGG